VAKLRKKTEGGGRRQFAAVPVRRRDDAQLEVLLLTSRQTRRWVIPKGWPIRRLSPAASAAREAFEEAGLEGMIAGEEPIGSYRYRKGLNDGRSALVTVAVFLLIVSRQHASWPEQNERTLRWCQPEEAAQLVDEPELAALLRALPNHAGACP
jgi:8-oxo-dGTP pyrophosphatase MutT (NUDIX family)